jgi:arylsulfatase A-like enzyme
MKRSVARVLTPTLLALVSLAAGCGDSSDSSARDRGPPPARDSAAQQAEAEPPTETEPARDTGEEDKTLPPLPGPAAYFGDLGLERVTEPVEVRPMEKGSVVLIVVDTLNTRHLSLYGYERKTSPELDKLAAKGVTFTGYISNSSWTRPSFTTILTGQPKRVHKVELNGRPLGLEITTVAERFRKAGYRTAGFVGNPMMLGKWGFDQGYQVYEDCETMDIGYFPRDQYVVDKALRWLKRVGKRPFFLMLFLTAPHPPYVPPRAHQHYMAEVPEGEVIRHPYKEYKEPLPADAHARIVAAYDGEVHYTDEQVGRIVKLLDELGRAGDTTIAFTVDHGEMFGQHNCYLHAYHMYEQTLNVPLVLVSPAIDARGVYDDRPFTHIDLAPTLLELSGVEYAADDLPGLSIVELLGDPTANRERVLFSQYNAHSVRREAIRKGRLKLVHHHKVPRRARKELDELHPAIDQPDPLDLPSLAWDGERYELFDLVSDPAENTDLFSNYEGHAELAELIGELGQHLGKGVPDGKLSDEVVEALRALGYIGHEPPN